MRVLVLFVASAAVVVGTASADIKGRWCDIPVPGFAKTDSVITLQTDDAGAYSLKIVYGDGSQRTFPVRREGGRYYTDNDFGEYYAVGSNGQMSIYDSDGYIRTARPTQSSSPKACR